MEKYTTFSDSRTGVHPFMPTWTSLPKYGMLLTILRTILLSPISLLRLILSIIAILLLIIGEVITLLPSLVHRGCGRFIGKYLAAPGLRLLFFALGINSIGWKRADPRRLKLQPEKASTQLSTSIDSQSDGDIIISNYTGFMDVLLLHYFFRPHYIRMMTDQSLDLVSVWDMLKISMGHLDMDKTNRRQSSMSSSSHTSKKSPTRGQFRSLLELQKHLEEQHLGPVVVFPEGHKSNGTVLLQWMSECLCPKTENSKVAKEFFELMKQRCTLVGFQYDRASRYPPPHTVYGGWYHIIRLSIELNNSVIFIWTNRSQVAELLSNAHERSDGTTPTPAACLETLRLAQNRMLIGTQLVDLNGDKAEQFAEYFGTTQKLQYQTIKKKGQ